jgi:hypothetical protein
VFAVRMAPTSYLITLELFQVEKYQPDTKSSTVRILYNYTALRACARLSHFEQVAWLLMSYPLLIIHIYFLLFAHLELINGRIALPCDLYASFSLPVGPTIIFPLGQCLPEGAPPLAACPCCSKPAERLAGSGSG